MTEEFEGQLCPYVGCSWKCGFHEEGWHVCPKCYRLFWARSTDSDYEDFHCYTIDCGAPGEPDLPGAVPVAEDWGPSWATPKGEE